MTTVCAISSFVDVLHFPTREKSTVIKGVPGGEAPSHLCSRVRRLPELTGTATPNQPQKHNVPAQTGTDTHTKRGQLKIRAAVPAPSKDGDALEELH